MPKPVFEVYKDKRGEWRWRLKAPNRETIVSSSKGYKTKVECIKRTAALRFYTQIATTSITEQVRETQILGYTKQVFFSHSSNDKELIGLIKLAFEFTPVKAYFARLERAARNPADKIHNEIGNSKSLFALITSSVFAKTETLFWVLFEMGVAKGKDLPIYIWIEEGCKVPEFVRYITDYIPFKPDEFEHRQRAVHEMVETALKL